MHEESEGSCPFRLGIEGRSYLGYIAKQARVSMPLRHSWTEDVGMGTVLELANLEGLRSSFRPAGDGSWNCLSICCLKDAC